MNTSFLSLEIAVVALGLGMLLLDLWTPAERKRDLGYVAAMGLVLILAFSLQMDGAVSLSAFGGAYRLDGLALYFKRFFLLAAVVVLFMSVDFADRIEAGIAEYYALQLFALAGVMFAASAHDFTMLVFSFG